MANPEVLPVARVPVRCRVLWTRRGVVGVMAERRRRRRQFLCGMMVAVILTSTWMRDLGLVLGVAGQQPLTLLEKENSRKDKKLQQQQQQPREEAFLLDPSALDSTSAVVVGQALHLSRTMDEDSTEDPRDGKDHRPEKNLKKEFLATLVAQTLNHRHAFLAQTSETGRRIHHRMAHSHAAAAAAAWSKNPDIETQSRDGDDPARDDCHSFQEEYNPYGLLVKNVVADVEKEEKDADYSCSPFDFQYYHGKECQGRAHIEFRHPFAGMKLHVFQNQQQKTSDSSLVASGAIRHTPSGDDRNPKTTATTTEHEKGDSSYFDFDTAYELMEPMHLELGIPPKHYSDYAYTPVYYYTHQNHLYQQRQQPLPVLGQGQPDLPTPRFPASRLSQERVRPRFPQQNIVPPSLQEISLSSSSSIDPVTTISGKELEIESCKAIETDQQHAENQDAWWKWWFSFTNPWWRSYYGDATHHKQSEYTMGHTAFAGGSHGQVWRGRRVCRDPSQRRRRGEGGRMSGQEDDWTFEEHSECDEDRPLILKRLKVEQGYRLLEAGLREIYFGQWAQALTEDTEKVLFTTYVDHFFRELPRAAFGSSTSTTNTDLELWIVFEDAGPSLRNYMYAPVTSSGGFVMYQHSPLWTQLRMTSRDSPFSTGHHYDERGAEEDSIEILHSSSAQDENAGTGAKNGTQSQSGQSSDVVSHVGRHILRNVLQQILSAAAVLHEHGIVHRDIKPSNVMCLSDVPLDDLYSLERFPHIHCRLGDFSSGWDPYTADNLYTKGPSPGEQTDEYAPPESYIDPHWVPFDKRRPQSYDSWSIGVLALELLLGTPNVFSVDQRTTVLLTSKMKKEGASDEELQRALYLAALSQFCIYVPNSANKQHQASWPYRNGDPLYKTAMAKDSCTLQDFHRALRARDPLGMGFDSSTDLLLHLIWQLVAWDPVERITAAEALEHPFFRSPDGKRDPLGLIPGSHNALESQMLDPRLDFTVDNNVQEFICPRCGRVFSDWRSCIRHATTRRHAKFCTYDRRNLPTCINTHSMLPAHPTSGYCDLQGRRHTIEDFHSIHLYPEIQFYGMFDGHTGNVASKYAASTLFDRLVRHLPGLQLNLEDESDWKAEVEKNVSQAFQETHEGFLEALSLAPTMDQSGTTATALLVTSNVIVVASLGDSRAVFSSTDQDGRLSGIQLTNDHVASDPRERAMVLKRGGSVFSTTSGGLERVNGTLAITRSIGDAALAPMLSRIPEVTSMTRDEIRKLCGKMRQGLSCFVVLASDGLWDVMSNQEAVDMVAEVVAAYDSTDRVSWNNGGAFQEAAEVLAVDAFVRGSTDNIGVCVVALLE